MGGILFSVLIFVSAYYFALIVFITSWLCQLAATCGMIVDCLKKGSFTLEQAKGRRGFLGGQKLQIIKVIFDIKIFISISQFNI